MFAEIKGLIKHSSVYTLGNLLSKIVSFIMLPVYTRCLSPSDYGTLEMLTLTASVITMLLSMRITSALPRFYFGYKDEKQKNSLVSTMLIFSMLISTVVAFGLFESRFAVSRLVFKSDAQGLYFGFIFASMVFEICGQIGYTYLRVIERSVLFVGFSMVQLILGLSLNILFLVHMKMGVIGVLYSMVISNGLVFLMMQIYAFSRVGFSIEGEQLKSILKFTLPLVPASLAVFVLNMGDRFILTRFVNTAEIGTYSLGYKFGILLGVFVGSPFIQAWEPKRVQIYETNPDAKAIYERVFLYMFTLLVFGSIVLSSMIREIVTVMAAPGFLKACIVTPFVAFGYAFYIMSCIVDIGIFLKKKTYWYPIMNSIAAAVNVGLNFLLIPRFGILGAAMATLASFFVLPFLAYLISQHYYPLRYDVVRMAKVVSLGAVVYFLTTLVDTKSIVADTVLKVTLLSLYPIGLMLTRFFGTAEMDFAKGIFRNGISRFTGLFQGSRT
jgi:O-antigen/teichoic acid export membrane protein